MILHEDNLTGGIGAEISSIITENYFEYLDAPIIRVCSIDTPIPFSSEIERDVYLPINRIEEKINKFQKNAKNNHLYTGRGWWIDCFGGGG